ncbi:MAG: hypothetical protein K2M65_00330 [Muribaculaceae bacterium]|nr:hypothetical protein [Muribaculaceae bacterium]
MENIDDKIKEFLSVNSGDEEDLGNGEGCGYGCEDGRGYGTGYGYGYGSGYNNGTGGRGSIIGSMNRKRNGHGDKNGYGYGCGNGHGHGHDHGCGYSYNFGFYDDCDVDDDDDYLDFDDDDYDCYHDYTYCYETIKEWQGRKVYIVDGLPSLIDSVHGTYAKGKILKIDFTTEDCYIAKVGDKYFAHGDTLHKAFEDARSKAFKDLPVNARIAEFKKQYPDKDVKIPATELYEWHNRLTGSCEMGRKVFAHQHNIDIKHDSFTTAEFVALTKGAYKGDVITKLIK